MESPGMSLGSGQACSQWGWSRGPREVFLMDPPLASEDQAVERVLDSPWWQKASPRESHQWLRSSVGFHFVQFYTQFLASSLTCSWALHMLPVSTHWHVFPSEEISPLSASYFRSHFPTVLPWPSSLSKVLPESFLDHGVHLTTSLFICLSVCLFLPSACKFQKGMPDSSALTPVPSMELGTE